MTQLKRIQDAEKAIAYLEERGRVVKGFRVDKDGALSVELAHEAKKVTVDADLVNMAQK